MTLVDKELKCNAAEVTWCVFLLRVFPSMNEIFSLRTCDYVKEKKDLEC